MRQIENDGGGPGLRIVCGCQRLFRFVQFLDVQSKEGKTSEEWRVTADGYENPSGGMKLFLELAVMVAQWVNMLKTTERYVYF